MPSEVITVEGLAETCSYLDGVSEIVATRCVVNGLDAAGEVMEAALWPLVPVDLRAAMNAAHGGLGALSTRLTRTIEVDPRGRGGVMELGFGPLGHIALWVEYGHRIVKGKWDTGKMTRAFGFMRRAFDASSEAAIEAYVNGVRATLKTVPGYSEAA